MTGIELIAQERKEQIEKHGWKDGEETWWLPSLVKYILMDDHDAEKDEFGRWLFTQPEIDPKWQQKFDDKKEIERLIVAGALLAAEIDRLQKIWGNIKK